MLALSFLILVGVTLIVEGFDVHVPKRLYLLCDGVLGIGGDAQYPHAQETGGTGQAAQADQRLDLDRQGLLQN